MIHMLNWTWVAVKEDLQLPSLNNIRIDEVQRVERMSGPDATMRFGTNNDGGAILVTLRR